ncbi:MAG: aldehyde-activating protein [Alteromonadaceae bacterium]|nr:MAG: aldehyde-activating protein [Alteromonadaceae bacterium]
MSSKINQDNTTSITDNEPQAFDGSCLCGQVSLRITPPLKLMQYCHCARCRKVTGSAHASNIYIDKSQLQWVSGEALVKRFEHPDAKYYAAAFCSNCGSSLPWQVKQGDTVVVPAGCLDGKLNIEPKQNIYWDSRACWFKDSGELPKFAELPPRKPKPAE